MAVIFDYDGVLVDSLDVIFEKVRQFLHRKEVDVSREQFLDLFNENFYDAIQRLGLSQQEIKDQFPELQAYVILHEQEMPWQPKMRAILQGIAENSPTYVITSNFSEVVERRLRDAHIHGVQVFGADKEISKEKLINELIGEHNDLHYVGDTVGDIRTAKRSGATSVAVTWGWHTKERLAEADPDHLVDYPQELLDLIARSRTARA